MTNNDYDSRTGLTPQETEIMHGTAMAWHAMIGLEVPLDHTDQLLIINAINTIQRIFAHRAAARVLPEYWHFPGLQPQPDTDLVEE